MPLPYDYERLWELWDAYVESGKWELTPNQFHIWLQEHQYNYTADDVMHFFDELDKEEEA